MARTIPEEFIYQIHRFIDGEVTFPQLSDWAHEHFQDIIAIDREDIRKVWQEVDVSRQEFKDGHATEPGIRKTLAIMVSKMEENDA